MNVCATCWSMAQELVEEGSAEAEELMELVVVADPYCELDADAS